MQGRLRGSRRNRAFSSSMLRSVVVRGRSGVGQARTGSAGAGQRAQSQAATGVGTVLQQA